MGWKPFDRDIWWCWSWVNWWRPFTRFIYNIGSKEFQCSLNDLCSIDSWLWQFVCEKWFYDWEYIDIIYRWYTTSEKDPAHRLMLSSIQEDKEKFILDNIVIK